MVAQLGAHSSQSPAAASVPSAPSRYAVGCFASSSVHAPSVFRLIFRCFVLVRSTKVPATRSSIIRYRPALCAAPPVSGSTASPLREKRREVNPSAASMFATACQAAPSQDSSTAVRKLIPRRTIPIVLFSSLVSVSPPPMSQAITFSVVSVLRHVDRGEGATEGRSCRIG